MQIAFKISGDGQANLTPASKAVLADIAPLIAADYMQDVLCDALDAYNDARERCGFGRITKFER